MLKAPTPIDGEHSLSEFYCGEPSLDSWLQRRALRNQSTGATRTFVICEQQRVVAYYALASSAIATTLSTGRFRRNMPDPIPVIVLARLAVDQQCRGRGLGRALVRDAFSRILLAAGIIGIRGVIVHALSETAQQFYEYMGFDPAPIDPTVLMVTIQDLQASIAGP